MPHPTYTSSGTVHLVYDSGGKPTKILFTAATHHTVEHAGKKFAVFVADRNSLSKDTIPLDAKAVELKNNHIEVGVGVGDGKGADLLLTLAQAVIKLVGVDITVAMNGNCAAICKTAKEIIATIESNENDDIAKEIGEKAKDIGAIVNRIDASAKSIQESARSGIADSAVRDNIKTEAEGILTAMDEIRSGNESELVLRGAVIPAQSHKK